MKDRIPLYPGRVKMTPVSGQANIYDMERADQPTQEGTPLNKATLLSDATAAALGLAGDDPTVDEALASISKLFDSDRCVEIITSSKNWIAPDDALYNTIHVLCVGGGGAGGIAGNTAYSSSGGGGSGQFVEADVVITPGDSYAIQIGAGGAKPTTTSGDGGNGGSTIFGNKTVG